MNLTDINIIKDVLKKNHLCTKKSLGQNFLISQNTLNKIIESAKLSQEDVVVEIGPGLGVLTEELARKAKLVLAIEKDYKLVEFLRKRFKSYKNVKIIYADILQFDNLAIEQFNNSKVVANLPYNITSPVIRKFLEAENRPSEMVLMVQKEVAERLTAAPGDSNRGITTLMVEFYGSAGIVEIIRRDCFWPVPKVDSAIVKITIKQCNIKTLEHLNIKIIDPISFMRIVKIGFSQKRRQIHHPLASGLHLSKGEISDILKEANISSVLRAEDLRLEDWVNLYRVINSKYKYQSVK